MSASSGGLAYRQDSFHAIIGPVPVTEKSKHRVSLLHLAKILLSFFFLILIHFYPSYLLFRFVIFEIPSFWRLRLFTFTMVSIYFDLHERSQGWTLSL